MIPQMSPIQWADLLMYFSLSLMVLLSLNYSIKTPMNNMKVVIMENNQQFWKW